MLTGELRSQVDAIWNAFWTCGISNPMAVIEQITYLPSDEVSALVNLLQDIRARAAA
ncbi:hypothetical protein LJR039_003345 [Pseudorhodoferax sp. LjRoot39]|uniref:hypothetical protein n=1 Tax=Pseudorhodoferax sp. LjRoot39 TaxID=3342328 RepID=UPI003ECD736B